MVAAGYSQEALTLGPYNLEDPMELEVSVLRKDRMEVLETLSEKTTSQALEILQQGHVVFTTEIYTSFREVAPGMIPGLGQDRTPDHGHKRPGILQNWPSRAGFCHTCQIISEI